MSSAYCTDTEPTNSPQYVTGTPLTIVSASFMSLLSGALATLHGTHAVRDRGAHVQSTARQHATNTCDLLCVADLPTVGDLRDQLPGRSAHQTVYCWQRWITAQVWEGLPEAVILSSSLHQHEQYTLFYCFYRLLVTILVVITNCGQLLANITQGCPVQFY